MKIYIDKDYKCYTEAGEGLTEIETDVFDHICPDLIPYYRYVPSGHTWTREDGKTFEGEMLTVWDASVDVVRFQMEYDMNLLQSENEALKNNAKEKDEALTVLGVKVNG